MKFAPKRSAQKWTTPKRAAPKLSHQKDVFPCSVYFVTCPTFWFYMIVIRVCHHNAIHDVTWAANTKTDYHNHAMKRTGLKNCVRKKGTECRLVQNGNW